MKIGHIVSKMLALIVLLVLTKVILNDAFSQDISFPKTKDDLAKLDCKEIEKSVGNSSIFINNKEFPLIRLDYLSMMSDNGCDMLFVYDKTKQSLEEFSKMQISSQIQYLELQYLNFELTIVINKIPKEVALINKDSLLLLVSEYLLRLQTLLGKKNANEEVGLLFNEQYDIQHKLVIDINEYFRKNGVKYYAMDEYIPLETVMVLVKDNNLREKYIENQKKLEQLSNKEEELLKDDVRMETIKFSMRGFKKLFDEVLKLYNIKLEYFVQVYLPECKNKDILNLLGISDNSIISPVVPILPEKSSGEGKETDLPDNSSGAANEKHK